MLSTINFLILGSFIRRNNKQTELTNRNENKKNYERKFSLIDNLLLIVD